MVYEACKCIIDAGFENNQFMTKDMMIVQVEMFKIAESITLEQYDELKLLLNLMEVTTV